MPDAPVVRPLAAITLAAVLLRLASAVLVAQPGYTDSYYFVNVADRLAHGAGLTADFLWSPLEGSRDPAALVLPVTSHLFWVPLPTALAALGIAALGPVVGIFAAAQIPFIVVASLLPALAFAAARSLEAERGTALAAAAIVGAGGIMAPGLIAVDAFAPAALLGTAVFLLHGRVARGDLAAGLLTGVCVGLLYLDRVEGALFGLALLWLARSRDARRAALGGAIVALTIGTAWLARDLASGSPPDLFGRSALLVRYEDFFAYRPELMTDAALPNFLAAKVAALLSNLGTFVFAFAALLVLPLAVGLRACMARPETRAWAGLALLVYLAQSLVWTLHSTRGSYFHSLAAFFPFGIAIAAIGTDRLLRARRDASKAWLAGAVILVLVLSAVSVAQWDTTFNGGARVRIAALDAIPAGPFLALDAAAWRWLSGRTVVVTPADGIDVAACLASRVGARSIVLEAAHFRRYDALYEGSAQVSWLGEPTARGPIRVYPIRSAPPCPGSP